MRTTVDVDDDVLASIKEIARREKRTAGEVLSELARRGLTHGAANAAPSIQSAAAAVGFVPFASRGAVVSNELVQKLRDDSPW